MIDLFIPDSSYAQASLPVPRPFQDSAHEALRNGRRAGHKNQLIMAPTGAGKTILGLRVAHEGLIRNKRVTFLCDRTTLINQTSETADTYGLSQHGIIQADHWRYDLSRPFQIASAQTLANRGWPESDIIIVDEAHTQLKVWTEHILTCKASVVGLSATPFSPGLGKLFTNLINATTMHELTESGVLVPMKVYSCTKVNMDGAATAGGEWTDRAAEERGMEIIGDVVTEWFKYAEGLKTIVFGATIKHCEEIARQFNDAGIMAAVFSANTTTDERKTLLDEYRRRNSMLRVLVSVEALAKGFDVPDVGCVVDCRPLRKSLSTAIQMWGRGLRSSPETGKTECILLDHSGNIIRFLEDFTGIYFNGLPALNDGEKLDKTIRKEKELKEVRACQKCGHSPVFKRCMSCGFESISQSTVEHKPGHMQEVIIGKKKLADTKQHLWEQVCSYARKHSQEDKQKGRAFHLYKDIVREDPNPSWRFDDTPTVEISHNVLGQIRSKNIAYAKRRPA